LSVKHGHLTPGDSSAYNQQQPAKYRSGSNGPFLRLVFQNSPRLFFLKDGVAHLRHCFRQSVLLEAALGFRLQRRRSLQQLLAMSTHLDEASPGRTKNASLSGKPE
jgi:hypothetical protein